MEEKDKKGDFSIKSTFQSWLDIEGQQKVTFLFGNTAVGKTTVCQLIKKIIDDEPHPNLKLIQKKKDWQYECEGEINPKSIKPLTIYPKKYNIKSQNMCIVQVPSRIYSLQKKRPFIDKILNTVGLVYTAHQGSFIFAIDAKNTSGKCEPWKKTFQAIFDNFDINLLNEKIFKSVGFIVISKIASNDLDKEAFLNRIQDLYKLFDEQKRKNQYYQLLKTIQKQKNLSVFKKTTQNQEIIQKDILQIFELISKLSKSSISLQKQLSKNYQMIIMEPVMLDKEEESHFEKFNQTLGVVFDFFSNFFQALFVNQQPADILRFGQKGKSLKKQNIKDHFLKKISLVDSNIEHKQQKIVKEKLEKLRKISEKNKLFYQQTFGKASILIKYRQKIQQDNQSSHKTLSLFLQILAEHGLIEQSSEQLPQLQALYLQLIKYSIFEQRFGPFIKNINYKKMLIDKNVTKYFGQLYPKIMKTKIHQDFINNKISLNVTSQQARKYLQIIDKFFSKDEIDEEYAKSIPMLKKSLMLLTFDRSDPLKAITQIDMLLHKIIYEDKVIEEIEKNKDNLSPQTIKQIQFLNNLALQVAKTLQDYGRPDLCAQIFQDCGNFHSAIQCYKIKLKSKQSKKSINLQQTREIINAYLQLLMDLDLYQEALKQCYQLAQIFKPLLLDINKKRKQIKQKRLISVDQQKEKKLEQRFLNSSLKISSFYSNKYVLDKIKQIALMNRK